MRRGINWLLLTLFSINTVIAGVEAEVLNHYLYPDQRLRVHVDVEENFTGTADLKFCLAEFDFQELNYNYRCDKFLNRYDITFDKVYSNEYEFIFENIQPLIYRLFVQLHFNDKYHKDCDKNNFIYLTQPNEPIVYIKNPKGIIINNELVPEFVEQGEEFKSEFNITNQGNCTNYTIYSFIYSNNTCITGKFWTNKKEFTLPTSSTIRIGVNNTIQENASIGLHDYVMRIKGCNKEYELRKPIQIIRKQNPYFQILIEDGNLVLKNYDSTNLSYELLITTHNSTRELNNQIPSHTRREFELEPTSQYLNMKINHEEVFQRLLINNTRSVELVEKEVIIYKNNTSPTSYLIKEEYEEKPFYIICFLSSLTALTVLYKRLK